MKNNKDESKIIRKDELLKKVSKRARVPKYECEAILDAFQEIVEESLVDGNDVRIRGFINFELYEYGEREGYNPITGTTEIFDAVKLVRCKVGKPIKDAVKLGIKR